MPSAPTCPLPTPALWQVTAPDGRPAGWLFGTIHALPDGAKWRTPAIDQARSWMPICWWSRPRTWKIRASLRRRSPACLTRADLAATVAAGSGLDASRNLRKLLAKGGYREADFKAIETWAAAIMLAQLADDSIGENGVDRALLKDFHARPIEEFEGVEGQFRIFDSLPETDQRDLLGAVVEEDTMTSDDSAKLAKLWLQGDMAAIAREGDEGMLADPELKQALLVDRNRAWADKLLALYAAGKRPLVAVGAAHLAPPGGLPELLAAKGYTVARVR